MDLRPTWEAMIEELIYMIGASDSSTTPETYDWAWEQMRRIGEHLDSLPADHELPMVSATEFLHAKRAIFETV